MIRKRTHIGNALRLLQSTNGQVDTGNTTTLALQPDEAVSVELLLRLRTTGIVRPMSNDNGSFSSSNLVRFFTRIQVGGFAHFGFQSNVVTPDGLRQAGWDVPLVQDQLAHLVFTKSIDDDPNTYNLYFNGILINDRRFNPPFTTLEFGPVPTYTTSVVTYINRENAAREDVDYYITRVYDKELSASETQDLYFRGLPDSLKGNLLLNYEYNQTSGGTAWDLSGNNNHGTINNPTWVDEKGNTAR